MPGTRAPYSWLTARKWDTCSVIDSPIEQPRFQFLARRESGPGAGPFTNSGLARRPRTGAGACRYEASPSPLASNAHSSIAFNPQFPAFAAPARGGRFGMLAERAKTARLTQEDEKMTKDASGEQSITAHRGRRAIPPRQTCVRGSARTKSSGGNERAGADTELMNISINIDKFTGLFDKYPKINLVNNHRKVLKYNDINGNMSVGRLDNGPENHFSLRICPQFR